jgi:predicted MFS family arabinose efflux permease
VGRSAAGVWQDPGGTALLTTGLGASLLGSAVTEFAIPVVAATVLAAGPSVLAVLAAIPSLLALALRLPAGRAADASTRRFRVMTSLDLARAGLLLILPAAWWAGRLSVPLLIAVMVAVSACTIFYTAMLGPAVPTLAGPWAAGRLNGRVAMLSSIADVSGPAAGGVLLRVLAAPVLLLVDSVSYLVSAVAHWRLLDRDRPAPHDPARPPAARTTIRRRLADDRVFRWLIICIVVLAGANAMCTAQLVLYATRTVGLDPGTYGLVMAAGASGGIVAGALVGRALTARGVGAVAVAGASCLALSLVVLPAAHLTAAGPVAIIAYNAVGGAGAVAVLVAASTHVQTTGDPSTIGVTLAFLTLCTEASVAGGALAGGALAEVFSVPAVITGAGVAALALARVLIGRLRAAHRSGGSRSGASGG